MKSSFLISHIRTALKRQLLYPAIVLIAAFLLFQTMPIQNHLSPTPLRAENRFQDFYTPDNTYVKVRADSLYYTGYDYVVNGRKKGHYYYTLLDDNCQFYILPELDGQAPELVVKQQNLVGHLKELSKKEYERLLSGMSTQLQWREDALKRLATPYIFSSVGHYQTAFLCAISFLSLCLVLSLFDVVSLIFYYGFPLYSPQLRQLWRLGRRDDTLETVEEELHKELLWGAGKIFLTTHYLVNLNAPGLVLLTDNILWVYYHQCADHFFHFSRRMSAVLHVCTRDGKTYDFSKVEKEDMDVLLDRISQAFPQILAGYTEQNRLAASQIAVKRSRRCM